MLMQRVIFYVYLTLDYPDRLAGQSSYRSDNLDVQTISVLQRVPEQKYDLDYMLFKG